MKKLISILLTITMLFSIGTAVFAADMPKTDYPQKFWDVPKDHWAFGYIAELVNKGVLAGDEDGSFRPDAAVTRAEWAKIMVLAAGLPANDNNIYCYDMSNHWANIYVNTAKDYLAAYTDGTFKPDQAAVREDVTVSMVKLKGYDVNNVDYSYLNRFTDTNSISDSLKTYVAVAVQKDLISGFEDGTFRGQNTLTRAEAATLLWRALQYGNDNKVVDMPDTPVETPSDTVSAATPAPTEKPKPTKEPEQVLEQKNEKPYRIDTLKKVDISDDEQYTYGGGRIYYISGTDIYSLDPYTGDTKVIYSTDDLVLQKTETRKKKATEIVTEEVVVEKCSNYTPIRVKYDEYNDRVIMIGYYKNYEKEFAAPNNDANYYVAYDITNDEVFWNFGRFANSDDISFKCFLSKDKAILYDNYREYYCEYYYIINTETKSEIGRISGGWYLGGGGVWHLYPFGNAVYEYGEYSGYLKKYDLSDHKISRIVDMPLDCSVGMNGESFYYWDGGAVSKLNLSSGKVSELPITANSKYCNVLDMSSVSAPYILTEFIPVSDTHFVFYDTAIKAFRILSEA